MNFNPGGHPICIDSGASCSISKNKSDSIEFTPTANTILRGITSGLQIEGKGTLCWTITNDNGDEIDLYIRDSLYVPSAPRPYITIQVITYQSPSLLLNLPRCHAILFPMSYQTQHLDLSTNSINLSAPQQKLLLRHYQLGHLHMAHVQSLAREGLLSPNNEDISSCDPPLCKACMNGKQHRRPISSALTGPLDSSNLKPGDCVSCNRLESTSPGLIPVHRGTPSNSSYHAGTLFIDHASRYLYFTPHISTGALEAIQAKNNFELHASSFKQTIKKYHSDNVIFNSKQFKDICASQKQHITF
jgi:hypothetical protein